ncbi:DUF2584 family protein [Clostridium butyricum]|uniref:DUF2584 family protein n=1 Tax=Clostridium butyricum TaxID=1492 RepID=UPI002ABD3A77|nr:DUF2584 family protein [Clostridium butyricum]
MGVSYEMNWYLVVENRNKIQKINDDLYKTIKSSTRLYPVGSIIPLILKNEGCIGIIEIDSFEIRRESTEIRFKFLNEWKLSEDIKKHYKDMYLYMKKE